MSGAHSHAGHRCGNEAAEGQPSETSASSRRSGAMTEVNEVEEVVKEVVDELQPLWAGYFWDTPWGGFPVIHVKKIMMNVLFIALVLGGWWGRSKIPLSAWAIGAAFAVLPLAASRRTSENPA